VTKRIFPAAIWNLYNGITTVQTILTQLSHNENPDRELYDYFCEKSPININVLDQCRKFVEFMDQWLYIDRCKTMNTTMQTFEQPIIRTGISAKLDVYTKEYENTILQFKSIHEFLNRTLRTKEKNETEYVKIHETEKSGSSLQITKKRASLLKQVFAENQTISIPIGNNRDRFIQVNAKDVKITTANTSNDEISFPELTAICRNSETQKKRVDEESSIVYLQFLAELEKHWYGHIETISHIVARIDVLQCKAYIAREYRYCKPQIRCGESAGSETGTGTGTEKSFVQAKGLRHPLIEHIQKNEIYVENDLSLGTDSGSMGVDGILLYGTNAVGKTSMIRALGISVILAQSGMYVPCTEFEYWPYTAIYSRILGNDNLFKGLSTFAVEMSELRIILKMADERSLVLGDELCSGTETGSALSIFTAGLMHLHEKRTSFIFATHFHEIIHYEEIAALKRMKMMHMTVIYDRERDCLVYDRRLKPGAGNHLYGLEVCKSLYLESEFLECAYMIRNKYNADGRGELSNPQTAYNAGKIRSLCEMCHEMMGEETHHLLPQKLADADGFIGTVHKNHKANLISVCEKCHQKIHASENDIAIEKPATKVKMRKVKTTKGFMLISNTEKAK
jgi:DNA mismatch repair protein MutS